ncbi:HAD-IA family hydrolase [Microbulbifer hydrolyticus]|uniref:HAD-IA family hydrolase n=1 Tax=Microbulbifer hydrolyticus TaxID=48074 RepID=A0A6P1TC31_9GAMM|nr:HAD-IA family hydrolase [Microbulbifer hydrolyticus]MBB5210318.1 phosphoglycolate phosphatase [Microbulbifer hydrolyticus]QHQ39186.1 HAD-IA family hydrolase [Microbulbifer hydrolyticus]
MLVILDWDGTVCNSEARIISCMQRASDRVGLPVLEPDAIGNIIGLGLPEAISSLFPEAHSEQRAQLGAYYSEEWLAARAEPLPLFDGVLATLDKLLGAGHQLAVATGKSRRGLNREFEDHGIGHLFPISRCADETASKPNPKMLREILSETGVHVSDAVMVGDTEYDLKMASAIDMASIGVSYGVHSRERLDDCRPHRIIDHFTELLQWPPLVA